MPATKSAHNQQDRDNAVSIAFLDPRDIHADLTWLVGALARDLMARGRNPGVVDMLARLSQCDFGPRALRRETTGRAPCPALPEAITEALGEAEETAMAIAAAQEHLAWETIAAGVRRAAVLGPRGPLRAERTSLSLLLAEPGAELHEAPEGRDGLFFLLAGPSRWRTQGGTLLAMRPGQTLFVSSGHGLRMKNGSAPLLAAALHA